MQWSPYTLVALSLCWGIGGGANQLGKLACSIDSLRCSKRSDTVEHEIPWAALTVRVHARRFTTRTASNLLLLCITQPCITACPPGVQRIISYDLLLLHTDNVTASNEDAAFNPDEYLFHRSNVPLRLWCTVPFAGLVHHVNATFTEPVVITELISSGFSNGYVNNFTVEYSMDGTKEFTLYRDDEIEKVCYVHPYNIMIIYIASLHSL